MLNLEHIENASSEVKKDRSQKVSKVLKDLVTIVVEANKQEKPVTIKLALKCLNKEKATYGSYIRTLVTKNPEQLRFGKKNGVNVIKLAAITAVEE